MAFIEGFGGNSMAFIEGLGSNAMAFIEGLGGNAMAFIEGLGGNSMAFIEGLGGNAMAFIEGLGGNAMAFIEGLGGNAMAFIEPAFFKSSRIFSVRSPILASREPPMCPKLCFCTVASAANTTRAMVECFVLQRRRSTKSYNTFCRNQHSHSNCSP